LGLLLLSTDHNVAG